MILLVILLLLFLVVSFFLFAARNTQRKVSCFIDELWVYPVKSLSGIKVRQWPLVKTGLLYDRNWMIVREDNHIFVTQRQCPKMCLIQCHITTKGELTLKFENNELKLKSFHDDEKGVKAAHQKYDVEIWGNRFMALDCGDEASEFLSRILNIKVRLVETCKDHIREPDSNFTRAVKQYMGSDYIVNTSFADGFPFLMTNIASLKDLRDKYQKDIDMLRFRSNIVVSGSNLKAYEEDCWKRMDVMLKSGSHSEKVITLHNVKPCTRCTVPSIDPNSGQRDLSLVKLLRDERMSPVFKSPLFGINLVHEWPKKEPVKQIELKVGHEVVVRETQDPPPISPLQ